MIEATPDGSTIILTLKLKEVWTYVGEPSRRDCGDSALTSSSLLNNPVIIPSLPGWAWNFPAKQHKKQQQKIIIHSDVLILQEGSCIKSCSLFFYVSRYRPTQ